MKAISLWQPWASWIAWQLKPVETRPHKRFACLVGQRIAIHAARKWDAAAMCEAQAYLAEIVEAGRTERIESRLATRAAYALGNFVSTAYPSGRIVATAVVTAHRELTSADSQAALCDCEYGRFGLFLSEVREVAFSDPLGRRRPGAQGIFNVEVEAEDLVKSA